ncbi:MAG: hypothetical protein J6B36_08840 [Muribaculaceae bacterium]|jgi:hypothetical protein|nr:hypothetical protein [Muribaculaceae bacterium]CCX49168.1 unknown [Bacteroides sp. CAG:927]
MKFLIALAVIFAVAAIAFLCASLFVEGGALVYTSIGAGLSLVAFILVLVGYASKAAK